MTTGRTKKRAWLCGVAAVALGLSTGAFAQVMSFNLPSQEASRAIPEFARQAGVQIVAPVTQLRGVKTREISGNFDARAALAQMLDGTGLIVASDENGIITLKAGKPLRIRGENAAPGGSQLAQTVVSTGGNEDAPGIEEVIVTASKRAERLIDVPQSVSVLLADDLARGGATQLRDFATTVPGLTFTTVGAGNTQINLRGVTAGTDISATVSLYIDDVPYGSSSSFALSSTNTLDVALFDLDRIEVLRGPQGTLYGAAAMGGLIKYVPKAPNTERLEGALRAGLSETQHGGVSYNVAGALNAPLAEDRAGLRVSVFESHDGGFVDNFASGQQNVDRADIYGGRADLLFTPSDTLTVRIAGFLQDIDRGGQATADYTLAGVKNFGSLGQRRPTPESFDQAYRLISGTIAYDAGPATLTSVTSYQTTDATYGIDVTAQFAFLAGAPFNRVYSGVGSVTSVDTDKFTQEVRLASNDARPLEWLIGAFYTHEKSGNVQVADPRSAGGQPAPNDVLTLIIPSRYEDYAVFGDLTYHITDAFDVTGGVRYARNEQTVTQNGSGLLGTTRPTRNANDSVFTYLANARYHFSPHSTGYFRFATGYRPGGPNIVLNNPTTGQPLAQATFESDQLKSYEIGFKTEMPDRTLGVDVAAYYIDWNDIQIAAVRNGIGVRTNAPAATVRGAELTLKAQPSDALDLSGAFAYIDAELSQAAPDFNPPGADGERLINVPRFTAALNADYELAMGDFAPTIGATFRYVSERKQQFGATGYRLPNYTQVDLRTGADVGAVELQLYVHNLFDRRGQLSQRPLNGLSQVAVQRPRTVGVNASTRF